MPTLFQIGADLISAYETIDDLGGELPPELESWFDQLATDEAGKLDSYVGLIRQADAESAAAMEEMERWKMRAQARKNLASKLKERIKQHLELTNRTKAETATGRVLAVQKNGGKQPLVVDWLPLEELPERFKKVTITEDREKIADALAAGEELPFARLEPRGTHLRIK
jgi:Siphovirus Gp157